MDNKDILFRVVFTLFVKIVNNLLYSLVYLPCVVGDVMACHVRPRMAEAQSHRFPRYIQFRRDGRKRIPCRVNRHVWI